MPNCSGRCTITKSKWREFESASWVSDDEDCPEPPKRAVRQALIDVIEEKTADQASGCYSMEDCSCKELPDQDPEWAGWVETPVTATLVTEECTYTLTTTVEVNRRVFDGVCYENQFVGLSKGLIPDLGVTIKVAERLELTPKILTDVKKYLSTEVS